MVTFTDKYLNKSNLVLDAANLVLAAANITVGCTSSIVRVMYM